MRRAWFIWLALTAVLPGASDAPKFTEFKAKVKDYVELVDRLDKALGRLPDRAEPEQINQHRRALADAIRKSRTGARQGDIFVAGEQPVFRAVLRSETAGREGAPARQIIKDDNPKGNPEGHPTPPVALAVNGIYPDGAPRSTVPPTILLRLPKLPDGVEFRFVGKALILYDARANLIVDFIPNAL
jgi:hypothetical protein